MHSILLCLHFLTLFLTIHLSRKMSLMNKPMLFSIWILPAMKRSLMLWMATRSKYEYGGRRIVDEFGIHNLDELEMKVTILGSFNWRLFSPTTKTFVDLFLCFNYQADDTLKFLCSYLMDFSLLDQDYSQLYPSILAAAYGFLAQFLLHPDEKPQAVIPWN